MIAVMEQPRSQQDPLLSQKEYNKRRTLAVTCLVLYLVSWISMITGVASVAVSLHMVKKRYVVQKKAEIIAFSVLELIAFAFVLSFSWYYEVHCYTYNRYTTCTYNWYGWISFVVWGAFTLAFGIPRVVFCWRREKGLASSYSPVPNQMYVHVVPAQPNYSSAAGSV